eukprot:CAMPEP_0206838394 /NCGR_PEP_ID=MMETSP0975-20121206/20895_1 /ASSEMBLY_ACC=CAM_ASM_000399 /TAXON_ID=483370 /ORGANISM="non described non described, Strain CCMP2097" /LENGTH=147 /DNA_ID=CAMNT_0054380835 /DNA_START=167 /DNA_END=610 /DNA_ORIENTATION=+
MAASSSHLNPPTCFTKGTSHALDTGDEFRSETHAFIRQFRGFRAEAFKGKAQPDLQSDGRQYHGDTRESRGEADLDREQSGYRRDDEDGEPWGVEEVTNQVEPLDVRGNDGDDLARREPGDVGGRDTEQLAVHKVDHAVARVPPASH